MKEFFLCLLLSLVIYHSHNIGSHATPCFKSLSELDTVLCKVRKSLCAVTLHPSAFTALISSLILEFKCMTELL